MNDLPAIQLQVQTSRKHAAGTANLWIKRCIECQHQSLTRVFSGAPIDQPYVGDQLLRLDVLQLVLTERRLHCFAGY